MNYHADAMMAVMSGALPWSKGTLLTRRRKNKSKAVWRAHPLGLCLLPALFKNIVLIKTAGHGAIPLLNTL